MKLGYINRTQFLVTEYFVLHSQTTGMDYNKILLIDLGDEFPRRIMDPVYKGHWNVYDNQGLVKEIFTTPNPTTKNCNDVIIYMDPVQDKKTKLMKLDCSLQKPDLEMLEFGQNWN